MSKIQFFYKMFGGTSAYKLLGLSALGLLKHQSKSQPKMINIESLTLATIHSS